MSLAALLFCSVVLYAPHGLLCAIALMWQPTLIVISLLSAFMAFLPLIPTGVLFQLLQLGNTSDATAAVLLTLAHFLLQNCVRLVVLHGCLQLQGLGWSRGWLLVRSRVPLVSLSIAVGAGFAGTSVLVSAGALLAEAWAAHLITPGGDAQRNATAAVLADLFAASPSCAQLPRLVQSCFQQTFFTCGQVAWTVMLGQAYAAAYPQALKFEALAPTSTTAAAENGEGEREEGVEGGAAGVALGTADPQALAEHSSNITDPSPPLRVSSHATAAREEIARLVQDDETYLPLVELRNEAADTDKSFRPRDTENTSLPLLRHPQQASGVGGGGRQREEAERESEDTRLGVREAAAAQPSSISAAGASQPHNVKDADALFSMAAAPHSPVLAGLVAESVLSQSRPAALLTGLAAVGLHLLYVVLPLPALTSAGTSSSTTAAATAGQTSRGGCSAHIPLQCVVTAVSVAWGLWVVHHERHPSAYTRLSS